ncbi:MAG TPA: hypothetical protein VFT84_11965 [Gemmatimonadales bacterium]|nr:hypothetical protein [Gemmatimonadales bacterium]
MEGELDSVVALGDRAVPLLGRALKGPAAERRANMRRQAEGAYALIADSSIMIRQTFLDRYEANYISSYQARAAVALGRIGTPSARRIVMAALQNSSGYRTDVQRALGAAVRAVLTVVAGDGQHAPLDSFVRVEPVVRVRDSATGAGIKGIRVRFFVDSGGGRADSMRITDDSGRVSVRWRLGPDADDSLNLLRVVAGGRAARIRATGHPDTLRLVFTTQPGSAKAGQAIVPTVHVAAQDAWGSTDTSLNQPATVTVVGTHLMRAYSLVAGRAQLTGFTVPMAGVGFRIRAETSGAVETESDSFDVAP